MHTQTETDSTNVETTNQAADNFRSDNGYRVVVYPADKVCEYDGWTYYFKGEGNLQKEEIDGDGFEGICLPVVKPDDVHTSLCIDQGWLYCLGMYKHQKEYGYHLFRIRTDGTDAESCCDCGANFNPDKFLVCDGWVYYLGTDKGLYRMKADGSDQKRLYEGINHFCIVGDLLIFEDGQDICKATVCRGDETVDVTDQAGRGMRIVVRGVFNTYNDVLWYADNDWVYYAKRNGDDIELHQALADCKSQVACRFTLNSGECGDIKRIFVSDGYLYFVTRPLTENTLSLYSVEIESAGSPVMIGSVDEEYYGEYDDIHLFGKKLYAVGDDGLCKTV